MARHAGVVLAGGRSSRMGSPKAWLDWHGTTLLARVVSVVGRAVDDGPVVVVSAPGQELPALPSGVRVVTDTREGLGPLQGIASGLAALDGEADVAFVSSTDAALLHPAFVRRVLAGLAEGIDAAVPEARGHRQPLASAYRVELAPRIDELLEEGLAKPAFLYERCSTRFVDEAWLLADPHLAASDPGLASLENLNDPESYAAALAVPAPTVTAELDGELIPLPAWSVAEAIAWLRVRGVDVRLEDEPDPLPAWFPLAEGDRLTFGD